MSAEELEQALKAIIEQTECRQSQGYGQGDRHGRQNTGRKKLKRADLRNRETLAVLPLWDPIIQNPPFLDEKNGGFLLKYLPRIYLFSFWN